MFFIPLLIVRTYIRTYVHTQVYCTYVCTYIHYVFLCTVRTYIRMFDASMCLSIIGNIIIVRLSVSGNSHFNS